MPTVLKFPNNKRNQSPLDQSLQYLMTNPKVMVYANGFNRLAKAYQEIVATNEPVIIKSLKEK